MKERSLSHNCLNNSALEKESLEVILVDFLRFKKANPLVVSQKNSLLYWVLTFIFVRADILAVAIS